MMQVKTSKYIRLKSEDYEQIQRILKDKGIVLMTDKIGKPRIKSKTFLFGSGLFISGIALMIAFLTSSDLSLFLEANVPDIWLGVVVAIIGAIVAWLREATTEPIAK